MPLILSLFFFFKLEIQDISLKLVTWQNIELSYTEVLQETSVSQALGWGDSHQYLAAEW